MGNNENIQKSTYLTYLHKTYDVNGGTITCNLKFKIDLNKLTIVELIDNKFIRILSKRGIDNFIGYKDGVFTFATTGVAKESNPEIFDEILGKKIALTRAQENAFAIESYLLDCLEDYLHNKYFKQLYHLRTSAFESTISCFNHVCDLGGITFDIPEDEEYGINNVD